MKLIFFLRHRDESNTVYYRDVIAYVCGGSVILGALSVISLTRRFRSLGR